MTYTQASSVSVAGPAVFGADLVAKATPDTQVYSVTGAVALNTVLLTVDMTVFGSASIQCISMGTSGVVTLEYSNDGTSWLAATGFTSAGASTTTINGANLVWVPPLARFLRLRQSTAATAGTTSFVVAQTADCLPAWLASQPSSLTTLPALVAGSALVGDVCIGYRPGATNAASAVSCMSPATPAAGTIKATAGRLLSVALQNSSAGLRSVKFFNATAPTLGTTAAVFEIDVPAGGFVVWSLDGGVAFSTAITFAVTSAKGLTDNTATGLAVNDVSGFFAFA